MTHAEFVNKVTDLKKSDESAAREWLKNATRFQLMKPGVAQHKIPIKHITEKVSVIENKNCEQNIQEGIKLILDCYPTFKELIFKHKIDSQNLEIILREILKDFKANSKKTLTTKEIKEGLTNILKDEVLSVLSTHNHEKIGTLIEKLVEKLKGLKAKYEKIEGINPIVKQTNDDDESNHILEHVYKISRNHLPSPELPGDQAYFGIYYHIGEIYIYLDVIYDNAISLGLSPYFLYRKVLIHELAHAFHHRGIDAKDKIWDDFGYNDPTRVFIVEGLAQWHAMEYMLHLDNKERNLNYDNLITIIWMSLFQKSQYRHYLKWVKYSNENIRRTIVEARSMTGSLTKSPDFDKELNLNHTKIV